MKALHLGRVLRRTLDLSGRIDAESVAAELGLTIFNWPLKGRVQEVKVGESVGVSSRLVPSWRRWAVAHAIGHHQLHPGNHVWLRATTGLAASMERQAEEFAYGLLVDEVEGFEAGLLADWELAEYFGVPEEVVRVQGDIK